MAVSPVSATAAYQAAQRIAAASEQISSAAPGSGTAPASFDKVLADALHNAVGTMRTGEAASAQGATGQGDLVGVVNAVTAAELTLETVVAIRDRVIAAYQDIMKMPI
jgi:flagellar hook-basal body complex protein FliE